MKCTDSDLVSLLLYFVCNQCIFVFFSCRGLIYFILRTLGIFVVAIITMNALLYVCSFPNDCPRGTNILRMLLYAAPGCTYSIVSFLAFSSPKLRLKKAQHVSVWTKYDSICNFSHGTIGQGATSSIITFFC